MKPMAAETESGMWNTHSAMKPPIKASGTFTRMSKADFTEAKALKSNTKISNSEIGTTTLRRCMARSWFSNSPDQLSE